MPCSICGTSGHNARTCPTQPKPEDAAIRGRDRMIIAIDNSSEDKLNEIAAEVIKLKRKIDRKARGTILIGDEHELPHKIFPLLGKTTEGMSDE